MSSEKSPSNWDEDTSRDYLDYAKYFVPAREQQMKIMVNLLRHTPPGGLVVELCCGEGLLAEQILQAYPGMHYHGLDGSALMLEKAARRLSPFSERVRLDRFELADRAWRMLASPVQAVVSSLAIHHLNGAGKQQLFRDIFAMLDARGVFIVADMVEPVTDAGRQVAADAWDDVVRQRSIEIDGNTAGLDFFQDEHWNTYRYPEMDDIDLPSPLFDQLKWLESAGFVSIDVHFLQAGHAVFSGWISRDRSSSPTDKPKELIK